MNPNQLVNANVSLQKMNADIDDLALLERAQKMDSIFVHLGREDKASVLEMARAMAVKAKTAEIKNARQGLLARGVDLSEKYIEDRLSECRSAAHARELASENVTSIWGRNPSNPSYRAN